MDTVTAIAEAVRAFDIISAAPTVSQMESDRFEALIDHDVKPNVALQHSIVITVLPSVVLVTWRAGKGRIAVKNRADPTSRSFAKDLEALCCRAAMVSASDTYSFNVKKKRIIRIGVPSMQCYQMDFTHKKVTSRIIAKKLIEFKQDYEPQIILVDPVAPPFVEGQ